INTFANSRTAFASLRGKPFPTYAIPLKAGMSIGMLLISTELFLMLCILLFIPSDMAGPCFIGFAIGESLAASALRIAGGIFTMRIMMIVASGISYLANDAYQRATLADADKMNFEKPLTVLVWLTSLISVGMTYGVSYLLIRELGSGAIWWQLSTIISCGTLAGAIIPEVIKVFTSTESALVR